VKLKVQAPVQPGNTLADVRELMKTEKGDPPIDFRRMVGTSAIDGGSSEEDRDRDVLVT